MSKSFILNEHDFIYIEIDVTYIEVHEDNAIHHSTTGKGKVKQGMITSHQWDLHTFVRL